MTDGQYQSTCGRHSGQHFEQLVWFSFPVLVSLLLVFFFPLPLLHKAVLWTVLAWIVYAALVVFGGSAD
jgi:hypothetical protein